MNSILDFKTFAELDSDLHHLTTNDRDMIMGKMLFFCVQNNQKDLMTPLFDLVKMNGDLSLLLEANNLSSTELIKNSQLSDREKSLLLFYCTDLSILTGRGAARGPHNIQKPTKPTKKEQKIFYNSIKLWAQLITTLTTLIIAINGCESNKITRDNLQVQNELTKRTLDQKDRELERLERELNIEENKLKLP